MNGKQLDDAWFGISAMSDDRLDGPPADWLSSSVTSSSATTDDLAAERARLEAELAAATARIAAARTRSAELTAALSDELRAEIAASQERLADMDRRHVEELASIRDAAANEVDRILGQARREIEARASDAGPNEAVSSPDPGEGDHVR